MKMTNRDMINAVNRIEGMQSREEKQGQKLFGDRIRVIYAIKKNKEKLLQLLKPYNESREELLNECRAADGPDEDGTVKIRKDCIGKWNKAINELLDIEVEAEIHKIKFSDIEGVSLSLNDLEAIDFMLTEPEG